MNRRYFLKRSSLAFFLLPPMAPFVHPLRWSLAERDAFLLRLIEANDQSVAKLLELQLQRPGDRFDGGFPNAHEIPTAMGTASTIQRMASAYVEPASEFNESPRVRASMLAAIAFLRRTQHADGTIDLLSTNFHSTPDTAFVVEPLCLTYSLLRDRYDMAEVNASLKAFLQAAGEALIVGGIHTPNHRWVVSMALSRLNHLLPDARYVQRIDRWLMENIDIDPDGQFTERSTNTYSPLTDRCLITIARLLDRPALLDPARRNLEMMLYYIHPNGELATEASGRQDKYQVGTLQSYFYPYHFLALTDKNGRFAAMSAFIQQNMGYEKLSHNLAYFQEDSSLLQSLPAVAALPDDYEKAFPHSELVRIRRGDRDATLLAGNPTLLTFQRGEAVLQGLRIASSFFGAGQVSGEKIEKEGNTYVLNWELSKPYYQPYPEALIREDGNWHLMPKANRTLSEVQHLRCRVEIEETDTGLEVRFQLDGTDHVPVAIEMGFRKGGTLSGVGTLAHTPDAFLLESGTGVYEYGQDRIEFGPGTAPHNDTQLRGALPKLDALSVYITGFTPFTQTLRFT